ncbi:probable glutathione S-transferase [Cryptomeria japonica]|uniref:probable glutathione S-transferase n=1 Tax=Cryptomeria japonica TaxID=3369 RepID=UPI0027DA1848|nr:probable glutathione S-transferase [Cryptomeria japonica]
MNPIYKKIPVLIHEEQPVVESLIILQYIDEAWPSPSSNKNLLPLKPYDRATARFWADFIDKKFYDAGSRIVRGKGESQKEAANDMLKVLEVFESRLRENGKPYFGGEEFGFVDVAFIPFTSWFHTYQNVGEFEMGLEENFPCMDKWVKRCMERESVKKVLPPPPKVLDYILHLRKQLGID